MLTYFLKKYHPTGFHYMSVVLVHKAGFFVLPQHEHICEAPPARTGLGERCEGTLSLFVIPSFREIAVLVNDGSKLGDFRADFDTIVTKHELSCNDGRNSKE